MEYKNKQWEQMQKVIIAYLIPTLIGNQIEYHARYMISSRYYILFSRNKYERKRKLHILNVKV